MSLNKVMIIGRLGQSVKSIDTASGPIAKFSVAVSETWKDNSGKKQEKTEWISCCCFGQLALTAINYLQKGSSVYAEGKLNTSSYEKDGARQFKTEVVLNNIQFLDSKRSEGNTDMNPDQSPKTLKNGNYDDNSAFGGVSFSSDTDKPEPKSKYKGYNAGNTEIPF